MLPPEREQTMNDHDLLIRLDTHFEDFTKHHAQVWSTFTDIVHKFMMTIDTKADKTTIQLLQGSVDDLRTNAIANLEKKVAAQQLASEISATRKQTIITIGQLGYKFWLGLAGLATFCLTVYRIFK